MWRKPLAAAAAAAALLAATAGGSPASAQARLTEADFRTATTGGLARLCSAAPEDPMYTAAIGWCHGFILATGQYHASMTTRRVPGHPHYCLPTDSPTFDQVRQAFVGWTRANAQYDGERAVDGLMRFANATYPCAAPAAQRQRR